MNSSNATACSDQLVFNKFDVVNAVFLFFLFLGLGLSCEGADLKQVYYHPRAILLILFGQFAVMPFLGWAFSQIGAFEPSYAIALVIACTSPGGALSNIYATLVQADVPLSVGATALSSLVALAAMPINQYIYIVGANLLPPNAGFCLKTAGVAFSAGNIFLGILFGVLARPLLQRYQLFRTMRFVYVLSTLSGLVIIVLGIVLNFGSPRPFWRMPNLGVKFICIIAPCLISTALFWAIGTVMKMPGPRKTTMVLEVGIHNKFVATAVVSFLLDQQIGAEALAVPILFFLFGLVFFLLVSIVAWKTGNTDLPKDKSFIAAFRLAQAAKAEKARRDVYGQEVPEGQVAPSPDGSSDNKV